MLKEYRGKRDFNRTPEPGPAQPPEAEGPLTFVVQMHAARRLHYDFRLEVDGVLKSWSVPAGPSLNPDVKRLAVMVEDHPLDYASFEGVIPAGQYGAGQVIVWDEGDYSPDEEGKFYFAGRQKAQQQMREGLAQGKLSFHLRGHKLKGSWTLVRMKSGPEQWLLIKHRDDFASDTIDILGKSASVASGLTIEDIKSGRRSDSPPVSSAKLSKLPGVTQAPFPAIESPMLATSADAPFSRPDWLFEPKLDGYRVIAMVQDGKIRLLSRHGQDVTGKYSGIIEGLRRQPAAQLALDGEIIALDERGKLCFQCLQAYLETMNRANIQDHNITAIIYYVFDLLYLDGYSLHNVPLVLRKRSLERVLYPSKQVRFLEHFEGDGVAIYKSAVGQGLEGVIAKRKQSIYRPGQRSVDWLKIKSTQTDDFVIGGYTGGTGNRARTFGALLLGYYDDEGRLIPAGHVGTGFDDMTLSDLRKRLDALKTGQCPFATEPELNAPATWVRPEMVAEIKFSQWTWDGRLRAPVYMRLRDDKPAGQVRRTEPITITGDETSQTHSPEVLLDESLAGILDELKKPRDNFVIEVQGHKVTLSNLDKELWPRLNDRPAMTKRDLLIYLASVSPYLLEHLRDRPLTLSRYPGGIYGEHFFQKHWGSRLPEFVKTVRLSERSKKDGEYLLCNNLPALLWLGQAANIEFHSWFSSIRPAIGGEAHTEPADETEDLDALTDYPDFIVFDLDPYIYSGAESQGDEPQLNREGFARTCEAALWLKEILDKLSLEAFIKTSGRTGLHIYVPVVRQFNYHAVHSAAKTICTFVQQRHPKTVTTEWAVEKRSGKVFLDYNQNLRGKTLASVYSPRPAPEATVSAPLSWDELGKVYPTNFTISNMPDRLAKLGDLWANILKAKRDLKTLLDLSASA